jgi:WhiB family transcriptional regulator, redox-sensing transcriptional regulator
MTDTLEIPAVILHVPVTEERPWVVFSACRDKDPDMFFPAAKEASDVAVAICMTCPVRAECLDYALEARERFGVWGGLTEKQRRGRLRRTA